MKQLFFSVLTLAATFFAATNDANAQVALGVQPGISVPMGDFAEGAGLGLGGNVNASYFINPKISIGANISYHAFGEKDREISHIGFIPGVHMVHIPKCYVKNKIMTMLKQDNGDVPNFEIVQVRVDMGNGCKASERTRAYEIQCVQKDASGLAKRLQSGQFKTNPVYVPYRIKKSDPNTFKRAISRQNKILSEQWVIKAQGFTPEMIAKIHDNISPHVEAAIPTANTEKGEWKFLVTRAKYTQSIKWLRENWEEIKKSPYKIL